MDDDHIFWIKLDKIANLKQVKTYTNNDKVPNTQNVEMDESVAMMEDRGAMMENSVSGIEDVSYDSSTEIDREEMEIALYSQIHFEQNTDNLDTPDHDTSMNDSGVFGFYFDVEGNLNTGYKSEMTTADYVLNKSINDKYDDKCNKEVMSVCNNESRLSIEKIKPVKSQDKKQRNVENGKLKEIKKDVEKQNKSKKRKKSKEKSLAEKLILETVSGSEGIDADSDDSVYGVLGVQEIGPLDDEAGDIQFNIQDDQIALLKDTDNSKATTDTDWKISHLDYSGQGASVRRGGRGALGTKPLPRYYKPIRCLNCNEVGHLSKNCPKPKKLIACAFCSELGHTMRNCPDSLCYNCDAPGHDGKDCPAPKRNSNARCYRCQMYGHNQSSCPELWRQFHVTTTSGEIKKGKARKVKHDHCYNCTELDHLGYECHDERMSRYVRVSTPFICQYQSIREFKEIAVRCDTSRLDGQKDTELCEPEKKVTRKLSNYIPLKSKKGDSFYGRNNFDKMNLTVDNKQKSKSSGDTDIKPDKKKKKKKKDKNSKDNSETDAKNTKKKASKKRKMDKNIDKQSDSKSKVKSSSSRRSFIEEDFPRSNKSSKCVDIKVTLNNLNNSTGEIVISDDEPDKSLDMMRLDQDGLFSLGKIKQLKRKHVIDVEEYDDTEHQVHHNEWWNKSKRGKKSRKKKNKLTKFQE